MLLVPFLLIVLNVLHVCGCGQLDDVLRPGDGSFRLKFPQGPVDTGEYVNISYVDFWEEANEELFPGLRKDWWIIAILVSGRSCPASLRLF